jgi:hypothetical protein
MKILSFGQAPFREVLLPTFSHNPPITVIEHLSESGPDVIQISPAP